MKRKWIIKVKTIFFTSYECLGFQSDKNTSLAAVTRYAKTSHQMRAENESVIQVRESIISTKPDCVIIKAGGVEVVIDSKGLLVKGGEINAGEIKMRGFALN